MQFGNGAWEIGKVLKHMHCYRAIEIAVVKLCSLLTRGRRNSHCREALSDFSRHILPQLNAMVLLAGKILELNMTADTGGAGRKSVGRRR